MKMIKNKKKKKKNKRIRIITKVKNDSGISIKEELNHEIYIYRYIYRYIYIYILPNAAKNHAYHNKFSWVKGGWEIAS